MQMQSSGTPARASSFHPAMVRACAQAFALSVMPGNQRRTSIAADGRPLD
jgi:hypothetical protein